MKSVVNLVAAAMIVCGGGAAWAASGTLTGQVRFMQGQGNFCPTSRSCTGALYLQSEFGQFVGIPQVRIEIRNSSNGIIGTGSTDTNGFYSVGWSTTGSLTGAKTVMVLQHKDARFLVQTTANASWTYQINVNIALANGGTQNMGIGQWGSSGAPEQGTNIYQGAFREWSNALSASNKMSSFFTNVRIYPNQTTACSSSCADGTAKKVWLDNNAAYAPQARVMHEMGHVADVQSDGHKMWGANIPGAYCYPSQTATGCGWNIVPGQAGSNQWRSTMFQEGFATFVGDLALYNFSADAPHTCLATVNTAGGAACNAGTLNTEVGVGCNDHQVLAAVTYLWDVYDDPADTAPGVFVGCNASHTDNVGRDPFEFFDTLGNYVKGTGSRQHDNPWNPGRTAFDEWDGRGFLDFNWNFKNRGLPGNIDTDDQICMNCGWPQ